MANAVKKPKTSIQRRVNERAAWLQSMQKPEARLTDAQKVSIVRLVAEGATLVEIAAQVAMPSVSSIYRDMRTDPDFNSAMADARAYAAATAIDEAQTELREALESGDTDRMSIAASYHRCTTEYASKIAPREFGQLLKVAGADGGALTVQVMNYAKEGGQLIATDSSREKDPPQVSDMGRAEGTQG